MTVVSKEPLRRDATAPSQAGTERLVSLDVFRGATIAAMILVNDAGDWNKTYGPLLHAEWNGWTPTDLIFPFFLRMPSPDAWSAPAATVVRSTGRSCGGRSSSSPSACS